MAARPAAADDKLRAMVRRYAQALALRSARRARRALAPTFGDTQSRRARERAIRAAGCGAVHRLSQGLSRRTVCHAPVAPWPFPDAGRPCGLSGAHLRAA